MSQAPRLSSQLITVLAACAVCTAGWVWLAGLGEGLAAGILLVTVITAIVTTPKFPQIAKRIPHAVILTRHFLRFIPRKKLAVVSLVLTLLVSALWIRSYIALDSVTIRSSDNSTVRLASFLGSLHLGYNFSSTASVSRPFVFYSTPSGIGSAVNSDPHKSFDWTWTRQFSFGWEARSLSILFPCWVLFIFFALPMLICVGMGTLRYRRDRSTCCIACGYNLTGNTSGTCSECGAPI